MLKIFINNGDGLGNVDYTKYVVPTTIQMDDSINVPTLLSFTLVNVDQAFKVPVRSAYVSWVSTTSPVSATGATLFTGYITNANEFKFLGLGPSAAAWLGTTPLPPTALQSGLLFHHYEIDVKCTSDEYLLNIKSVPFIAAYVNQTMGEILSNIAETLTPGFWNLTNIQDGDLVPYFEYDPTTKWSDVAKQFADQVQFRYKVINKTIYFVPYGDVPLGIFYDETAQTQKQIVPSALETGILAVPLVNDALVIGDVEAQQDHDDYFCGDGFTGSFPLKYKMFKGDTNLLLQDDWTEQAFNNSFWFVQDLGGQFVLAGALNDIGTGVEGPLGESYILGQNGVELGGHLVLQHGEFQWNDHSTGIVGGIYSDESNLVASTCIAGFDISCSTSVNVTSSGADGIIMQPIASGALVGTPVTSIHNHHYVLQTAFAVREPFRYYQTYRSLAGTSFGSYFISSLGDVTYTISDIDLAQAYNVATLNNPFVPAYTPVVTKFTNFDVPLPSFAAYVILNSGGVDPNYRPIVTGHYGALNLTLNYTMIYAPPQANLYVAGLTGAQVMNPVALTGGQLPLYDPADPLSDPDTQPIGPYVHYPMGFGIDPSLVATITLVGDYDQLEFYGPNDIPGVGARIRIQAWQSGQAIARVRDPVSVAREAIIVGDDGVRSLVSNDLKPAPRNSYDCDYAGQAIITDREMVQYQGSYNVESYFWDNTQDYPRSGRFFNVTSPARGISGAQFLVREVTTSVLELHDEILQFNVSYGQDLYLDKLLRRFIAQPENVANILTANDTALPPNPQQIPPPNTAFSTYLSNLPDAKAVLITGTQVCVDLGTVPVTGVEVRRTDTGWASNTQNLVTVATSQHFQLPRVNFDQSWYMRMVNGSQTSRFTRVLRINYPMVPQPPPSVTVSQGVSSGSLQVSMPIITVQLPTSFDRNIYGVQIDNAGTTLSSPQQITLVSDQPTDARTAVVTGYDVTFAYVSEQITLNGTSPVTTGTLFMIVESVKLQTCCQ